MLDSLHFKAHKMLDCSTSLVEFFSTAVLRLIGHNIDDKVFDSEWTLFQRVGITLKICKMELAWQVLPLLMKPAGRIDFAFDTGLVVCLKDYIEDGELQVSFDESLSLQLAAEGLHALLFLAIQTQKESSIEDLLNFLIMFLIRLLLKASFLKQHKTDLEQYPLAPTSTAKSSSSTQQPLDSMIVFKNKYLLILVPCQDSIFSSQGHVSPMRITFLKVFEKIAMSGLS